MVISGTFNAAHFSLSKVFNVFKLKNVPVFKFKLHCEAVATCSATCSVFNIV